MVKRCAETAPLLKRISRGTSRAAGQVLVKHLASAGSLKFQHYLHEVVPSTSDGHGTAGRAAATFRERVDELAFAAL
jgi:hypothetical protein